MFTILSYQTLGQTLKSSDELSIIHLLESEPPQVFLYIELHSIKDVGVTTQQT